MPRPEIGDLPPGRIPRLASGHTPVASTRVVAKSFSNGRPQAVLARQEKKRQANRSARLRFPSLGLVRSRTLEHRGRQDVR